MNKIIIKGRIATSVELKTTNNGIPVCTFSVAVNRKFDKETTDFIICEAWRKTGEFVSKYFTKGQEILLTGELHIDKYQKDGENRTITKISVNEVEFCGSKDNNKNNSNEISNETENEISNEVENVALNGFVEINNLEELPF